MRKPEVTIEAVACEERLQVMEHLAHHAVSLLRRAKATVATIQSLAHERSLPWAVDEAVRDLDPDEIGEIEAECEDLIEDIRLVRQEGDGAESETESEDVAAETARPLDEGKPVPCAS